MINTGKIMKVPMIVVLLLIALISFGGYSQWKKINDKYNETLTIVDEKEQALIVTKESLDEYVNKNEDLKKEVKKFKKISSITKSSTNTIIDTIKVAFLDTVRVDSNGYFVKDIKIDSTYYKMDFRIDNVSFNLNHLEIPNDQTIIIGDKKIKNIMGISKGTEYTIDITNSNPYVQTLNIQNFTIKDEKKWYQTKTFHTVGGMVIGGYIVYKIQD